MDSRDSTASGKLDNRKSSTISSSSQSDNSVKFGVVRAGDSNNPILMEYERSKPVRELLEEICKKWMLPNVDDYALQLESSRIYLTENNKDEIKKGIVLDLISTPAAKTSSLLNNLKSSNPREKMPAIKEIELRSKDITFAEEFISQKGLDDLIEFILHGNLEGEPMNHALRSFLLLMEHSIVSWDIIELDFIKKVCNMLSGDNQLQLQPCLEVLECLILNSSKRHVLIDQMLSIQSIGLFLQNQDSTVKKCCISLINAMLTKADPPKKHKLIDSIQQMPFRPSIVTHVISDSKISPAMAHQLHVLQSHIFSQLYLKSMTPADPENPEVINKVDELLQSSFHFETDAHHTWGRHSTYTKDFSKLGFKNKLRPIEDFMEVPPGVLTLDNLVYFMKKQSEAYTKIILENSVRGDDHDCPIIEAAIALTHKLCVILRVGEEPSDEDQSFYPMFFCYDHSFEELFCICMQTLNKTWKDMRATVQDFNKVMEVVQEQINRSLQFQNPNGSFDMFRNKLSSLTYQEIRKIWETERQIHEEYASQAQPIVELREQLEPEILKLIKQQRINYLIEGASFVKYSLTEKTRRRDKTWYWRLSPNQKAFYYGDCDEKETSRSIEALGKKLAVSDIKEILTGKDCPHMERGASAKKSQFAFSIITESEENAHFVASDENQFSIWTDGLNALIGRGMVSELKKTDLETLMTMEIKMRLLDIECIPVPSEPPPIPKPPSNYNFNYKYSA